MMSPDEKLVEFQLTVILNDLLKNAGVVLSICEPKVGSRVIPLLAKGTDQPAREIAGIIPQWPDTYIIYVGQHRGLYLKWSRVMGELRYSLSITPGTDKPLLDIVEAVNSNIFKILAKNILEEYLCC